MPEYAAWDEKGAVVGGRRITLMADTNGVRAGEPVSIEHVYESLRADARLYPSGPKAVLGELVDGVPATPTVSAAGADPLAPATYNGPVAPGPGVDANFETTTYVFAEAGRHTVEWVLGHLRSNVLTIEVEP